MNKEQIDQLALEIYRGTDWEERLTVEQAVISLTTRFLARVDAERAKEGPAAWAVLSEVEGFNFIAQWPEACHEHINDYYTQCLENGDEIEKCSVIALYTHPQPDSPEGYKLLKDSTYEERSWPEDYAHENGNYTCSCCNCGRQFTGYKRRVTCKVCATTKEKP